MATKDIVSKISTALRPIGNHRIKIIRTIVQLIMFGLINGAIFGLGRTAVLLPIEYPTGAQFSIVWNAFEALQYAITFWIFPYLAIAVFTLFGTIFGKTTCGWVCPFGLFQDMFRVIPIKKRKVSRPTNKSLSRIGMGIVIFIVIFSFIIGITYSNSGTKSAFGAGQDIPFGTVDPAATLFATLYYYLRWGLQTESLGAEMGQWNFVFFLRIIIFIVIIVLITLFPRAYCRWICPTGALLGI
jgi:polyferredoxin